MRNLLCSLCLSMLVLPGHAAERVVALAPALTEMMLELDAGDLLVGVVDGKSRPAGLAHLPSVGRHDRFDIETLVSLQPDLLLVWSDSLGDAQRRQLLELGMPLVDIAPRSLDELAESFVSLGARIGREDQGRMLAQRFGERIAQLRQRHAREEPLRVFYQVWERPLYTLGGRQIVSDALGVCGAENIFAGLPLPAPQVSVEAVLQEDPQVILLSSAQQAQGWQRWPMLTAVHRGQVWTIPDDGLERPSFQMLQSVEALCRLLDNAR